MDEKTLLSEHVEQAALSAIHAAASEETKQQLGLSLEKVQNALVSISKHDASPLLNRTIGLGIDEPASYETVEEVIARYRAHNIARYYLHLHPAARPATLRDWLLKGGLERGRGWMKFWRGPEEPPPARSNLEVRRVQGAEANSFGRIVTNGFGMEAASARLFADLAGSPGWYLYVAFEEDTPAAAASLFVHEGAGWLDWAATLPPFRRRGAQSLLVHTRIRQALELGCRVLFTETGEAIDGDPQHSYRNILRAGFEASHLRENFLPPVDRG